MSINDILPTAVQGLQRQANRVQQSAENIARTGTGLPSPTTRSEPTGAPPPSAVGSTLLAAQESGPTPPATEDGLVTDLVTLKQASTLYKANLAVVEVADELAQEAIDLARRD